LKERAVNKTNIVEEIIGITYFIYVQCELADYSTSTSVPYIVRRKTMPIQKLKTFLDESQIKYVAIRHSRAYTAQEVAASAHIPGKEMAKTVMVKVDGKMSMVVLPACYQIDLELLTEALGADLVELATEEEFKDLFPACEIGAMPPFGNLYGMNVFMETTLSEDEEIAFNAGTHTELIKMSFPDYQRLVKPIELQFMLQTK